MDRILVWPGAIPLETDPLSIARNAMVSIAAITSALFGTTSIANGLSCTPTGPASLNVVIGPGEIYQRENLDDTPYSSLPADTAHQIMKQGINLDPVQLSCPAPNAPGTSINYLIEAKFTETDTGNVALPYYNASDPTTAYTGPNNSGTEQPTVRAGIVTVLAKPGAAAATGSQVTPAPDAGWIGLWVVTVDYGMTAIGPDHIARYGNASVVPPGGILSAIVPVSYASRAEGAAGTITNKAINPDVLAQSVQSGAYLYGGNAGGSANALTATLVPAPAAIQAGMSIVVEASAANTGAATLNLNGSGAAPITFEGDPLPAGILQGGQLYVMLFDGTSWQLQSPGVTGDPTAPLIRFANGQIIQSGFLPLLTNQAQNTFDFPEPFPTACVWVGASLGTSLVLTAPHITVGGAPISASQGRIAVAADSPGTSGVSWIAIGY